MASFSYLPALYQRNLSFHFQKESRSLTDLKDFCSSSLRKSILRQLNQKGTSFSDFAGGYRDCPTMLLNNLSGQIQTDASSALFADFRRSPSVKPLEYFMVFTLRDSDSLILDLNSHKAGSFLGPVKIYAQNYLQARLSEVNRQ